MEWRNMKKLLTLSIIHQRSRILLGMKIKNCSQLKKLLKGFTLVELLVVISIIAILSVIGITVFSGVQKNARDARRRGDINAIAKALEVNKGSLAYVTIDGTKFANNSVPIDSVNTTTGMTYCVLSNATLTAPTAITAAWTTAACPSGYSQITTAAGVTMVANATSWTVCASLEASSGTTAYCKSSSQ